MLTHHLKAVQIASGPGLTVEGEVRVTGIQVHASGFRLRLERQEPLCVIVNRDGREQRHQVRHKSTAGAAVMMMTAPILARIATRMLLGSGRRPT